MFISYLAVFDIFQPRSCDVLSSIIRKLNTTTFVLDYFPTILVMTHKIHDKITCEYSLGN